MEPDLQLLPDLEGAEACGELQSVTEDEKYYLIELLNRTTFDEDQKSHLERGINNCDKVAEFEKFVQQVRLNTIEDKDRIAMGFPYGAGDIKKTLRNLR